jgi:hypothetical protein
MSLQFNNYEWSIPIIVFITWESLTSRNGVLGSTLGDGYGKIPENLYA